MIAIDVKQGSPEWHQLRIGNPGASQMHKLITPSGSLSKQADEYLSQLVREKVTGEFNSYYNENMRRGVEREIYSIKDYEFKHGVSITRVGIIFKDERKLFHCSPDGMIGLDTGFETKDALPHIQERRLKRGTLPKRHFVQIQASLYITGCKSWVFRSYCEGMPALDIIVEPDKLFYVKLESALYGFVGRLHNILDFKEA